MANFWEGVGNSFTGNLDQQRANEAFNQQSAFNSSEAQKNRDWQEKMSNSAYQRAAADMKAAGFNPALAASSAQGASTPGGSAASAQAPQTKGTDGMSALGSVLNAIGKALGGLGGKKS